MDKLISRRSWLAAGVAACALAACGGGSDGNGSNCGYLMNCPPTTGYAATRLVSDQAGAPYMDGHLVNAWGIAFNPEGFVWVAAAGTSTSTLYDGNGLPQSLVVSIPPGQSGAASPTGIVYNGGTGFAVSQGATSGPGIFLFAGEAGTLSGWSPRVNADTAVTMFDGGAAGKVYKGLALATQAGAGYLYATDFHNGKVDVFDESFQPVATAGGFVDPALPAGYGPFGIQAIGDRLYVSYAKQDADAHDDIAGAGLGVVDVFDTAGHLVKQLIPAGGALDAPWGLAMAPAEFGPSSNALLVGNFGDGRIHAYDPTTGALLGTLSRNDGTPIVIDGLWGLAFGNGINAQPKNTLFYTAGPGDEAHGAYGRIDFQ